MSVVIPSGISTAHPVDACYGSVNHCSWHEVDEVYPSVYRVCIECGHAYSTAAALVADANAMLAVISGGQPLNPADLFTEADKIWCCAWCCHDF